jgi:hypothetical protein
MVAVNGSVGSVLIRSARVCVCVCARVCVEREGGWDRGARVSNGSLLLTRAACSVEASIPMLTGASPCW